MSQFNNNNNNNNNNNKQDEMQHMKERLGEVLKKKWKNKVMHGQYLRNMDRQLISEEDTLLWLSKGDLKAETKSEIVAAQDQALNTKYLLTAWSRVLEKLTGSAASQEIPRSLRNTKVLKSARHLSLS